MHFEHPDWSTVHRPEWKSILDERLPKDRPIHIVEVGCFEGRSTVWFADYLQYHNESRMSCVDTWLGGEEVARTKQNFDMPQIFKTFMKNVDEHPQRRKIFVNVGPSQTALCSYQKFYHGMVDFVYLDGSHTQRDTIVDLVLAYMLIRPGGVIIVDDYKNNMQTGNPKLRPRDAVDFFASSLENEIEFYVTRERQAVIIRK